MPQENLAKFIIETIMENFPDSMQSKIRVKSISIDEDAGEIRIELEVSAEISADTFAEKYFGLTRKTYSKIRDNFDSFGTYFPVITPEFLQRSHA